MATKKYEKPRIGYFITKKCAHCGCTRLTAQGGEVDKAGTRYIYVSCRDEKCGRKSKLFELVAAECIAALWGEDES